MNPLYPEVIVRANSRCKYCHAPTEAHNFFFDVEHIRPLADGGDSALDNLALACRSCNIFKGTRRQAADPETGVVVALFHPRRDIWEDHFAPDADATILIDLTPTGRATLVALQINSAEQQTARRHWIRLELFP